MTDEEAILAAVDGFWQSFLDANNPPDPARPDLARYSTGEALEVTVVNIRERQELGQAVVLPEQRRIGAERCRRNLPVDH